MRMRLVVVGLRGADAAPTIHAATVIPRPDEIRIHVWNAERRRAVTGRELTEQR